MKRYICKNLWKSWQVLLNTSVLLYVTRCCKNGREKSCSNPLSRSI